MALLTVFAGNRSAAQSFLVVDYHDKPAIVRKVHDGHPYVLENGNLVRVKSPKKNELMPAPTFLPAFIAVQKMNAASIELVRHGASRFAFESKLQSPFALKDVFLVLELTSGPGTGSLLYLEVGDLKPNRPKSVSFSKALWGMMSECRYVMRLFSEGLEVLSSNQTQEFRDATLDSLVLKRLEGVKNAMPTVLFGPAPEYPATLMKKRQIGEAVLNVLVARNGRVSNPTVESATDPAFAEKALATIQSWRFVPLVKGGHAVEAYVSVPLAFAPPE